MHKMKRSILATTLVAMTVCFSGVASANEATDKQAITNTYQAINAAFERKDINQYFSYLAPEYTYIGVDGKLINLKQQRQQTQEFFRNVRQIKIDYEIKQIDINGPTATVVGVENYSGTMTDPQNPQVTKPFDGGSTYQNIWKRTNYGWKIISTRILLLNNTNTQQQSNQTNNQRDISFYYQANNLANAAIEQCYREKNLEECEKLNKIKYTLNTWCGQGDANACFYSTLILGSESNTQTLIRIESINK
jgi:ketosteroid isomerase-like protein